MISRGACLFAFDIDWIVPEVCASRLCDRDKVSVFRHMEVVIEVSSSTEMNFKENSIKKLENKVLFTEIIIKSLELYVFWKKNIAF